MYRAVDKYVVRLAAEERAELEAMTRQRRIAVDKQLRAKLLYQAFSPDEARRLLEKLEIHYTPKHGSWLNMAETELGILSRQCLDRRMSEQGFLTRASANFGENRQLPTLCGLTCSKIAFRVCPP
jgi:hypothetical protein